MAINKVMQAALKALSYPDIDVKKNYKLERQLINATHVHVLKPFFKTWDHVISLGDHEIPVRLYFPVQSEEVTGIPLIVFFHGGGWVTGNIDSYDKVCTTIARQTKHLVLSVDYRLAPEYPFPAAGEDCYCVSKEIFSHPELFGIKTDQITLMGDSAGANLAAVVSLMARDRGGFTPKRQILIYPATYHDHSPASPFASIQENGAGYLLTSKRVCDYMELYMGNSQQWNNPYFAPLLAEDVSNQPNTLLITAEFDPLRDEGEAYGKKLEEAGNLVEHHRIPDALHGFFSLPVSFPQVAECYQYINHFLNGVL
jgi:acetyl esterase